MPPHTVKQCLLPAFCWLTSQHLTAERKKRANLISWEEPEDGGVERCQWLSSSESTHTHTHTHTITTPILCLPTTTVRYPAVLFSQQHDPGVSPPPLSSFSSLLYLFPSRSSSPSVHTHTEHILVFLPDCAWFICLCVFAHASARLHLHMCAFMWAHDYMNYVSVGGECDNLWLRHVCWVNKLFPYRRQYSKCIWMRPGRALCRRKQARGADSPGNVALSKEPEVLKTQPEEKENANMSWVKVCSFLCVL